jgi:hypothetical protein
VSCGDKIEALLAAFPTVAKWRVDTVPKNSTTDEVTKLPDFSARYPGALSPGYGIAGQ